MSAITILGTLGGNTRTTSLGCKIHIHNRVETFLYERNVGPESIPLDFLKLKELDSRKNVKIVDKRYLFPDNDEEARYGADKTSSRTYSSMYKDLLATNCSYIDNNGVRIPIYYAHRLDEGVTSASVRHMLEGNVYNKEDVKVIVDLEKSMVFVSAPNRLDIERNAYHIMWIRSSNSDGTVKNELLDAKPVAQEATWQDIDLTTGLLKDVYPLFTREYIGGEYKHTFSQDGPWWIKPLDTGLIKCLKPTQFEPDNPWYMRFTAGDVNGSGTSGSLRYYLPEHAALPFMPSYPHLYVPDEPLSYLSRNYMVTANKKIYIDTDTSVHMEIRVYDVGGNLVAVYTTNTSLDGTNYSSTTVKYDATKIDSWSSESGLVHIKGSIDPSWTLRASYYYESVDYQYTDLDVNPVLNPASRNHFYAFYVIPNEASRSVHHLKVDESGIIKEVSNPAEDILVGGSFNTSTSVGMTYKDATNSSTWYGTNILNGDYLLLAEVFVDMDNVSLIQNRIDVRREPSFIDPEAVFKKQPKLINSKFGYSEEGAPVATDGSVFVEVPLSVLETHGGYLTEKEVQDRLSALVRAGTVAVIKWSYPKVTLTADNNNTAGQVDLSFTWQGLFDYKTYKMDNTGGWVLVDTKTSPSRATLTYSETGLTAGVARYSVRVVENGIEYPGSEVSIRVL